MRHPHRARAAGLPFLPAAGPRRRIEAAGGGRGASGEGGRPERRARCLARGAQSAPPRLHATPSGGGARRGVESGAGPRSHPGRHAAGIPLGHGRRGAQRPRRPAREVQVRARVRAHQGQAAPARPDEGQHAVHDASVGGRVLGGLGLEVRARRGALDLRPRDGPRPGVAALRHQGDGADVHSGRRCRRPAQAVSGEDARVGLAGPLWGLGAAAAAYAAYLGTGGGIWAAIAHFGAWVNLFNLVPVWQLDGGHGFRALTRRQRGIAAAVIALMWLATGEGLLVLLLVAAAVASFAGRAAETPDAPALLEYTWLVAALSLMTVIHVPTGAVG